MSLVLNEGQRKNLAVMTANLIGDIDKTDQVKQHDFNVELFPGDMAFERMAFEAIIEISNSKIATNKHNLTVHLQNFYDDAPDRVEKLMSLQTEDGQAEIFAKSFSEWSRGKSIEIAVAKMVPISENGNLPFHTKLNQIHELIAGTERFARNFQTLSTSEMLDNWLKYQQKNIELIKMGLNIGPTLPWGDSLTLIPNLRPGEMMLMEAVTGYGKTTFGTFIAKHIAHEQPGYDSLFIHLETDAIVLESRFLSHEFMIPINSLERGVHVRSKKPDVSLDMMHDPVWSKKYEDYRQQLLKKEAVNGRVWYHHANGASVVDLGIEIRRRKAESEQEGRKLVVIIDYYQNINWTNLYGTNSGEAFGLNQIAFRLKELTELHDLFMIVLAQSAPTSNYEAGYTTRGAKEMNLKSQIVIKIRRDEEAEDNLIVPGMKNAFGEDVYFHRVGEKDSAITLQVTKSNNNATGPIPLRIINKYFKIVGWKKKAIP